jgi:transposase-like protein
MMSVKGVHFEQDTILTCRRWYVAYPLSYRHVEELMQERGGAVDHATINRVPRTPACLHADPAARGDDMARARTRHHVHRDLSR